MKRNIIIIITLLCLYGRADAQTRDYVQVDVPKITGIKTDSALFLLGHTDRQTSRTYIDGLGRTAQSVAIKASPNQHDMVQPVVYDELSRQSTAYLGYTARSATGGFHPDALTEQAAFYNGGMNSTIARDSMPWAKQLFENSPLQRVYEVGSIGKGFQPVSGGHFKNLDYRTNTSGDSVRLWLPDGSSSAYYTAGKLSVSKITDEEGIQGFTFTNDNGQLVLKRQQGPGSTWLDTYYIYNDAGQPIYVVPPKAVVLMKARGFSISATGVDKLLFKMTYDYRGRLTVKKVPASGEMYVVYDPLNRPVLMQDANLRALNKWNYIKYDVKGRAIAQGIYLDATHTTLSSMQSYVDGMATTYQTFYFETRTTSNTYWYYTNTVFPTSGIEPLAYSYYDDYHITNTNTPDYSYSAQSLSGEGTADTLVNGMLTAVRKRTVGTGLAANWLISVTFYDSKGRAIQTQSNNHLYATVADKSTVVTDFTGKPTITKVTKNKSGSISTTVQTAYTYDHADRVTAIDQGYNGGTAKRIANYVYNELGQLMKKNLGRLNSGTSYPYDVTLNTNIGSTTNTVAQNRITLATGFKATAGSSLSYTAQIKTDYLQALDYRYNIRGQLLTMNNSTLTRDTSNNDDSNDIFGMQMLYDQTDSGIGNTAYYNGRLSAVKWMSRAVNGQKTAEKSYKYAYDPVNRLTDALYYEKATGGSWTATGAFDEKGVTYDANGNILTLTRFGLVSGAIKKIDSLNYRYYADDNNRLKRVTDGTTATFMNNGYKNLAASTDTTQYDYDDNGNLVKDLKKGITQHYNILNRVDSISLGSGKWLTYTYDAGGTLLRKKQYSSSTLQKTTDYIDGFVFEQDTLRYFAAAEGRVRVNSGTLINEYVITDIQGNSRVSFEDNGNGVAVVRQENSYYPFGLIMSNGITPATQPNKNLYNGGSEWQNDYVDLPDYYQTFFRNYDAAIGRFVGVDPLAESAESMTPYQYAYNNPGMLNDPMGDIVNLQAEAIYDAQNAPRAVSHYDWREAEMRANEDANWREAEKFLSVMGFGGYNLSDYGAVTIYSANDPGKMNIQTLINILQSPKIGVSNAGLTYWTGNNTTIYNPNYDPKKGHTLDNWEAEVEVGNKANFVSFKSIGNFFTNRLINDFNDASGGKHDMVGLSLNGNIVDAYGGGASLSLFAITNGNDKGFYATLTPTVRLGVEDGVSASIFRGKYVGKSAYPNASDFLGHSLDIGSSQGSGLYYWESFNNGNPADISWYGGGKSFSSGDIGVSIGYGWTIGLYGFKK